MSPKLSPVKLFQSLNFCQDLVKVFNNYASILDSYFEYEENIVNHKVLYEYYIDLKNNLKDITIKNGFAKK